MRLHTLTALLLICATAATQNVIDLSGTWHLTSRLEATSVTLPGSLLTNGLGDPLSVDTRWTGSLYDSSFYFNPFMERYRHEGDMSFPFFLTPERHFVGEATYSRTVNVPKSWKRSQVTLMLERPHIETTVMVNGHEVGHQMSLSVPHQYDLTPYVRFGRPNEISIRVYNGIENVCVGQDSHSVTDQTQGNWNGIAGRIELRAEPRIYRRRVVTDLATQIAHITINERSYLVHVPGAKPWSEHSPQLYTATVSYQGHPVRLTFGFREVRVSGSDILLNGQRIHLRGTVENCCFPETGFPPTDTASWLRVLGKCKEYGLNHVRFHSYCPPDAAFAAADRLGIYLQPEGPSWPNHGVKLGNGMSIDQYLADECRAIIDTYGHHPSLVMLAAGNEPAGNWVAWGERFVREMKAYDPSRIYCTASVGGGWQWDTGSEYHVKGGARGLEWNQRQPSSDDDFSPQLQRYTRGEPTVFISHEQGQWCAFPDFKEIQQYTGAYKARNFEIFRQLLAAHGMASQAERFLMASGRLQMLAYKYEIERHLRTPHYAGFQLLSLNDYSGQGSALVGPLNVHWHEKSYCTAAAWRQFCNDIVPLAALPRFTYAATDTIRARTSLYNMSGTPVSTLTYSVADGNRVLTEGTCAVGQDIVFCPADIADPSKLTLTLTAAGHSNQWNMWVYPAIEASKEVVPANVVVIDLATSEQPLAATEEQLFKALEAGRDVLLCTGGRIRYGADVVHRFLPVFWNTSWFKMKPPHTTGAYIQAEHPVFRHFPTDDWQDLQWWELTNRAQCINLAEFPADYQPIVQPIDTWHLSRKLGMMVEARVLRGRLLLTTFDLSTSLATRLVARQLRRSILSYMASAEFQPALSLQPDVLRHLFERDAPAVDMFTTDSPDELKPKLTN